MHRNIASAVCVMLALLSACSREDTTNEQTAAEPQEAPARFKSNSFRAIDDKMVVRLVGSTEAEISIDGENYVCTYTEELGEIRVVLETFGTKKAVYFKRVEAGLEDPDGVILYDTAHYNKAMEAVLAQRRQESLNERLLKASEVGDLNDASLALHDGAELKITNSRGLTALHLAAISGNPALVEKLIQSGADPNAVDPTGATPLHMAADAGGGIWTKPRKPEHDEIMKILIRNGARLDSQETQGFTPLIVATIRKHREAVRVLVDSGANREIRSKVGKSAWDYGPDDWIRTEQETARYQQERTETKRLGTFQDVDHTRGRPTKGGIIVTDVSVKDADDVAGGKQVFFMDQDGPPEKGRFRQTAFGWNGFTVKFSSGHYVVFRAEAERDECFDVILSAYHDFVGKFKSDSAKPNPETGVDAPPRVSSELANGDAATNALVQARGIHKAMVTNAQWNKEERMPDDIGALIEGNYFTPGYTISPTARKSIPSDIADWPVVRQANWVRCNASYILIPNLTFNADTGKVAVFGRPEHFDGTGIPVAYNDNHVEWERDIEAIAAKIKAQTGRTIEELIARQQAYAKEAD